MTKNNQTTRPVVSEAPERPTNIITNDEGPGEVRDTLLAQPELAEPTRFNETPVRISPDGTSVEWKLALLIALLRVSSALLYLARVGAEALLNDLRFWRPVIAVQALPVQRTDGGFTPHGFDAASGTFVTNASNIVTQGTAEAAQRAMKLLRDTFEPFCMTPAGFACLLAALISIVIRPRLGPYDKRPPFRFHGPDAEGLAQAVTLLITNATQPLLRVQAVKSRDGVSRAQLQRLHVAATRRRCAVSILGARDVTANLDVVGGLASGAADLVVDAYAKDTRPVEPPALLIVVDAGSSPAAQLPTVATKPHNKTAIDCVASRLHELRWAVCEVVSFWHAQGAQLESTPPFSMFPGWSRLVGGVLCANGITDFTPTLSVSRLQGLDPEFEAAVRFLTAEFGVEQFFAGRALRMLDDAGVAISDCDGNGFQQRSKQFGTFLAAHEGEAVDGWQLHVTQHRTNQNAYSFVRADAAAADAELAE